MLDKIQDQYDYLEGFPTTCIRVTPLYPVTFMENQYFEPYPLPNGDQADHILDIRNEINSPESVSRTDCEFFTLYPLHPENKEKECFWIVQLPYVSPSV